MESQTRVKSSKGRVVALMLAVVVIAAGVWTWVEFRYDFIPKKFGMIVPGELYRSGQLSPRMMRRTLQEHGIKVIVDFQGPKPDDPAMEAEQEACKELGVEYHRFVLPGDGVGDAGQYVNAVEVMVKAQREHRPALIHCSAGAQRTGAATVFYRLLVEHKSGREAYEELVRYGVDPNKKDANLIKYINEHVREIGELLMARHAIDAVPNPVPQLPG